MHAQNMYIFFIKSRKTIFFLINYPNSQELKDGYFQRVKAIDDFLLDYNRIYLRYFEHERKGFFPKINKIGVKTYEIIISSNSLSHKFFQVFLILITGKIYLHSIFPLNHKFHRFLFGIARKRILDVHGVVPEETEFCGDIIGSKRLNTVENFAVNKAKVIIGVTEKMIQHLTTKYNDIKTGDKKLIVLPVIKKMAILSDNEIKKFNPNRVVYCGGTQKWQQIEKALDFVYKNRSTITFAFLVPEPQKILDMYSSMYQEDFPGIVQSVEPEKVRKWYKDYSFGLVLREDNIVNNVACPTKLIEYMQHDIVPIVDSPNIGDFNDLGYAYVNYRGAELPDAAKWEKMIIQNKQVLRKIYEEFDNGVLELKNYL